MKTLKKFLLHPNLIWKQFIFHQNTPSLNLLKELNLLFIETHLLNQYVIVVQNYKITTLVQWTKTEIGGSIYVELSDLVS